MRVGDCLLGDGFLEEGLLGVGLLGDGAGACVRRTLRILCNVRQGAGQKVRTLTVCTKYDLTP